MHGRDQQGPRRPRTAGVPPSLYLGVRRESVAPNTRLKRTADLDWGAVARVAVARVAVAAGGRGAHLVDVDLGLGGRLEEGAAAPLAGQVLSLLLSHHPLVLQVTLIPHQDHGHLGRGEERDLQGPDPTAR